MSKVHLVFCFLIFSVFSLTAEIPQISLLTCDSGDELYSTFGHSGVRVSHPESNYDVVYGYGTFDTRQKGFYLKFMRGKLLYYMSVSSYERFLAEYKYFRRSVDEQVLDLDSIQTFKMIDFLEDNMKEENKYYKYDFFFDNCSTRIRDILENEYLTEFDKSSENKSYRDLLDEKLTSLVWSDFGIDVVIGAVADRHSDWRNQMFLPSYLMDCFGSARVDGKLLVSETSNVLQFKKDKDRRQTVPFLTPMKILMALLFLILVWTLINNNLSNKLTRITGFIWYLMMAVFCVIIIFLWFFTDHLATKENWNLLWISPLFISGLVRYRSLYTKKRLQYIPMGIILFSVLALVFWSVIPQRFHIAFIPMMVISIVIAIGQLRVNNGINGWLFSKRNRTV